MSRMKQIGFGGVVDFNVKGTQELDRGRRSLAGVENQAEKSGASLDKMAGSFGAVGLAATGMATAATMAMVATIKKAAELEFAVAEVRTLLGPDSIFSEADITNFSERMGKTFGLSASLVANSFYETLSANIKERDVFTVLEAALNLAVAGFEEPTTAIDALTASLNAYEMQADRAGDVTGKLMFAVLKGKLKLGNLPNMIGQTGKIGASAGIEFEELLTAFARGTQSGLPADEVSTAIRATINTISNESKFSDKQMTIIEDLKLKRFGGKGLRETGMIGVMTELAEAMDKKGLDVNERQLLFKTLFPNIRAHPFAISLLSETERGAYGDVLTGFRGAEAGYTEKNLALVMGTTQKQLDRAKESIAQIMRSIGRALTPSALKVLEEVAKTTAKISAWIQANPEAVSAMGRFAVKATAATFAFGGLALSIAAILKVGALTTTAMGLNAVAAGAASAGIGVTALGAAFTTAGILGAAYAIYRIVDALIDLKEEADLGKAAIDRLKETRDIHKEKVRQTLGIDLTDSKESGSTRMYGAGVDKVANSLGINLIEAFAASDAWWTNIPGAAALQSWQGMFAREINRRSWEANEGTRQATFIRAYASHDVGAAESILNDAGNFSEEDKAIILRDIAGRNAASLYAPSGAGNVTVDIKPLPVQIYLDGEQIAATMAEFEVSLQQAEGHDPGPDARAKASLGMMPFVYKR